MNIKRIKQRTKLRAIYEAKSLLSVPFLSFKLFNTKHNIYTVGDMITLTSFMILFTGFVFISLMVGIPK